jgi:hypothetical protein
MSPADVYFTVGVFRSGGTITDGMVLIGSEIALADSATVTDEFPPSLDHLPGVFATNPATELDYVTVHELVHTVQPGRWGYDLLSQAVLEGIAEFVASVAMGVPSPAQSVRYGEAHRDTVRAVFEQELFSPWRDRWIWNDTTGPFPVRDLGYYVGYAMAQRHFAHSNDTARALATMLTLNAEDDVTVGQADIQGGSLNLTSRSGDVTLGGPSSVTGAVNLTAANGAISVTDTANNFGGPLNLAAESATIDLANSVQ